ncbi:DivIVA domain-containing protein, partial [Corynebacterium hesseae]
MPLSPADVHNVAFSKPPIGKRGYNEDEVDQFLDLVEDALAQLQDENDDLHAQVEELKSQTSAGAAGGATAAKVDEAAVRKEVESKLRAEYEAKLADSKNEIAKAKEETKRAQEQAKAAQAQSSQA